MGAGLAVPHFHFLQLIGTVDLLQVYGIELLDHFVLEVVGIRVNDPVRLSRVIQETTRA